MLGIDMTDTVSSLLACVRDLPDHEAIRLLLAAADTDRSWMLGDPSVSTKVADRFASYVARRRNGEPLQYIEGTVQFGPIELAVDRRVLIPRPETERLYELAMACLEGRTDPLVVDFCTGSGSLALALRSACPTAAVVGADVSPAALEVAVANASDLGLDVEFLAGDLFAALPEDMAGRIDLIVTNPPYVSLTDYANLPAEIAEHEPSVALVAGPDGLDILERIAAEAAGWLSPGGVIICEIGEAQGEACRRLFAAYSADILTDLAGKDRFVLGTAPMPVDLH